MSGSVTVLLAEDDPQYREEFEKSSKAKGFVVDLVDNCADFESKVKLGRINIVASDTGLAKVADSDEINNADVCKRLLGEGFLGDVYILGMSSYSEMRSLWVGVAHDFLDKGCCDIGEYLVRRYRLFLEGSIKRRYRY